MVMVTAREMPVRARASRTQRMLNGTIDVSRICPAAPEARQKLRRSLGTQRMASAIRVKRRSGQVREVRTPERQVRLETGPTTSVAGPARGHAVDAWYTCSRRPPRLDRTIETVIAILRCDKPMVVSVRHRARRRAGRFGDESSRAAPPGISTRA